MGEIRIAAVVVVAFALAAVGGASAVDGGNETGTDAVNAAFEAVQTNGTTDENGTDGIATGTVAGVVTYGNGSTVTNPNVTVRSTTATTYETGGYAATVPTGTHTVAVSLDGETVATRSVNVTEDTTTVADVTVSVPATIQGWVTGSDGQPISPVLVELREPGQFGDFDRFPTNYVARTQPDADGYYQLSADPGEYALGAGSVEYEIAVTNVSLSSGETLTRNFTLERADGGIAGTVTDESGTPVANATVTTLNDTASASTGSDGAFDLTMDDGTYTVVADADGYEPTTSEVTVQAGQTTEIDFSITERNVSESPLAVAITGTSGSVAPGETLAVDAALTNHRDETVSQPVTLLVNETTADDTFVSVPAGETRSVTLVWTAGSDASGSYTATVESGGAAASTVLTVDPALNDSSGDGTDDGDTESPSGDDPADDGGSGGDQPFDGFNGSDPPTFDGFNQSDPPTFDGFNVSDPPAFDGFNQSDAPTFEFGNESAAPTFGFGNESAAPTFEFDDGTVDSGFDFGTESDAPTFGFGNESGAPLFEFGDEAGSSGAEFEFEDEPDAPSFDFSSD